MAHFNKQNTNRNFQQHKKPKASLDTIYGIHAVKEAIQAGKQLNKLLVLRTETSVLMDGLLQLARTHHIPIQFLPKESSQFPANKNHQGVMAQVSPVTYYKLEDVLPQLFEEGKVPFILVLDRVTDVRNFGAIARSAYCAGVDALVIPDQGSAQITDDAIKTSAGALHHIAVCRETNMKTVMELLNQSGLITVACTEKGNELMHEVNYTLPVAIVMGNEESGISSDIIKRCTHLVKIPMEFGVQSLNVSVAAGIAAYEVVRQRLVK